MSQPTNSPRRRQIYLETFGCQMNVLDSELVLGQLRARGQRAVGDPRPQPGGGMGAGLDLFAWPGRSGVGGGRAAHAISPSV